ncbi:type II toxin-antitoxin system RelE/ParE family toxin [Algoriphagus hitonicola]|nr:type II toxin-antitoxin system RelE/ParE family toxin [Algoriphagus hitonicola]
MTQLETIFQYYKEKANPRIAKKLVNGIIRECQMLKKNPKIGRIEELLKERKERFRFLIYKNYKLIYWINKKENRIEIVDVFDTRQNPIKISRGK